MATQIQFRRGTRTQHASFTGATAEVTVNTTDISLHVHDGISVGGVQLARSDLQNVTGIVTFTSTNLNATTLNASGTGYIAVGIVTNLRGTNLNYSGIATADSISIGATQIISSGRQLQNIVSLDATTTATIESAIANAPNTFTDLNVTGVSTLGNATASTLVVSGFSTFSSLSVGNITLAGITTGLNVPGISTLTSITSTNVNITGITTISGGLNASQGIDLSRLRVTGITTLGDTTATNLSLAGVTTGINASGISTLAFVNNTTLSVTGFSTLGSVNAANLGLVGITTGLNSPGISTLSFLVGESANYTGISTLISLTGTNANYSGIGTIANLRSTNINATGVTTSSGGFVGALTGNVSGDINSTGVSTFVSLRSTNINATGVTTSSGGFVGALTGNVTGNVTGNATGLSGNPSITVTNATINGTLSVGGTSVILNAQQLQINDRDITLGITTDALGNNVANDTTANHGGISVASTVGTPIINIPVDGVNNDLATNKQIMWIKQNHYSGLGTDAWVFNYGVSIGNTSTVQNGSRLTVGVGFTVYDTITDLQNLRGTNSNITGISTALDFNATSDINLKTNITPIANSIEKIVKINGVSFNWKETQKPSIGVIAQNVEEVFPELVSEGDTKTVNYNGLVGALIEAVKEQQKQIDILKKEIENLKEN